MPPTTRPDAPSPPPASDGESLLPVLLAVTIGALTALAALPALLPALTSSLEGPTPKAYWYVVRASGFVAFGLLWLSMALGLAITNKLARAWPGGPTAYELHQHTSVLGLAFSLVHPLVLLGDHYSLFQIFVPFASGIDGAGWVGLGQIGLILLILLTVSYAVRRRLGHPRWRAFHYLAFAVFVLALAHGIASGTDAARPWASIVYGVSGVSVLYLTMYRIISAVATPPTPKRAPASAARAPGASPRAGR